MKINLGLETLNPQDVSIESDAKDLDLLDIATDLVSSETTMDGAFEEHDEMVRACENLNAVQIVVEKHGYTDALRELFGEQISQETLSMSTEGIMDKIKSVAKKAAEGLGKWWKTITNLFTRYAADFDVAAKQLKSMPDKQSSAEAIESDSDTGKYIPVSYITDVMRASWLIGANNKNHGAVKDIHRAIDDDIAKYVLKEKGTNGHNLKAYTNSQLYDECVSAKKALLTCRALRMEDRTDMTASKQRSKQMDKEYDEIEAARGNTKELKQRVELDKKEGDLDRKGEDELLIRSTIRMRRKFIAFLMKSCNQLRAELKRRGCKFHE